MEYPLCDRTVTVYRQTQEQVLRQVVHGCYFQQSDTLQTDAAGSRRKRAFLLVMPGSVQRVFPGDRVMAGEGPTVSTQQWARFIPALVPGLSQVGQVKCCYWQGKLCHTEATQ